MSLRYRDCLVGGLGLADRRGRIREREEGTLTQTFCSALGSIQAGRINLRRPGSLVAQGTGKLINTGSSENYSKL